MLLCCNVSSVQAITQSLERKQSRLLERFLVTETEARERSMVAAVGGEECKNKAVCLVCLEEFGGGNYMVCVRLALICFMRSA